MAGEPQFVEHARDGDVHVLRIANAPVNTLRTEVRAGLLDGIKARRSEGARAIVLIGAGRNFSAGAEMTEFGKPRKPPSLPEVFDTIEQSKIPVVAAIHGNALGGGLELALGLPCPGRRAGRAGRPAGGEARLRAGRRRHPAAAAADRAWMRCGSSSGGDPVSAEEAVKLGFVDAVLPGAGDLEQAAVAWARAACRRKFTLAQAPDRQDRGHDMAKFDDAAKELTARSRGQESPKGCVEIGPRRLHHALRGWAECRAGAVHPPGRRASRARRCGTSSSASARRRGPRPARRCQAAPVNKLVVIGGGTMGGGIAMSAANNGLPVTIVETSEDALQKGLAALRGEWQRSVSSGRLTQAESRSAARC